MEGLLAKKLSGCSQDSFGEFCDLNASNEGRWTVAKYVHVQVQCKFIGLITRYRNIVFLYLRAMLK